MKAGSILEALNKAKKIMQDADGKSLQSFDGAQLRAKHVLEDAGMNRPLAQQKVREYSVGLTYQRKGKTYRVTGNHAEGFGTIHVL